MLANRWTPTDRFRLLLVHSTDSSRLAKELELQLPDFGFACRSLNADTDLAVANRLINSMDGAGLLLTRRFLDDPICHQAGGFALARGIHLHCVEISARPSGLLEKVPTLVVPTDSALPRLIAQFVARDPLSSQRFSLGVVEAVARGMPKTLLDNLPCLESLRVPSTEAVVELKKIRQQVRGEVERTIELRLDLVVERWQQQVFDDAL